MYILISTIFIAEIIIALQIIVLIRKADKKVCDFNEYVKSFNPLAKTCLEYARCISKAFSNRVDDGIKFIKKQQDKIIIRMISTVAIYSMLILFKIKRLKAKKIFNLAGAIRELALDFAI